MIVTEQELEVQCMQWLEELGWTSVHGADIAPDGEQPARSDFRQVVLRERLFAALARINPQVPVAALEQAAHELLSLSEPLLIVQEGSC